MPAGAVPIRGSRCLRNAPKSLGQSELGISEQEVLRLLQDGLAARIVSEDPASKGSRSWALISRKREQR